MCDTKILKYDIEHMQKKLDKMDSTYKEYKKTNNQEHKELLKGIKTIEGIMSNFILKVETKMITKEEAEKKFASKLSERLVYSTAGMMLTAMITGIIFLVINH